jgi:hypothetical protein
MAKEHRATTKSFIARFQGKSSEHWMFYVSLVFFALSIVTLALALNREKHIVVATPQKPFNANQNITLGSATVSVGHINYSAGSPGFSAPSDKHYLILDFTVRNNSDKPINVLPTTDTYVKDTAGRVVYVTPFALSKPFHAGELSPGEQVTGQLSYLVPKNAVETFYVDAIWSGGVLPVAVK